jgi:hypothetical protein
MFHPCVVQGVIQASRQPLHARRGSRLGHGAGAGSTVGAGNRVLLHHTVLAGESSTIGGTQECVRA